MADYVRAANDATLIAIQLEEREAIENLDELLQVPDVDVFFVGPSDLSQSMGHPGNPKAPPVAAAIEKAFERIVAAGRIPGTPATVDNVKDVLGKGVRYIYNHVPRLLAASSKAFLGAAR
jgi:4-hydroxy-2-oxoheptanedioate aldolase